jgi:hypothetical protein
MNKKILISVIVISIISLIIVGFFVYRNYTKDKPCSTCNVNTEQKITVENRILMFGRSVMAGWFTYWGASTDSSFQKQGYTLEYHELNSPPDIVSSFNEQINKLSSTEKPIIFFKLCFVDFAGGSKEEAEENLAQNKKYIEEVYNITHSKDLKLIIGNALPQVSANSTDYLKWNHEAYNQWLQEFAAKHSNDLTVFNMYDILKDTSGNLKPEYTNDQTDSHPNDAGYNALDGPFFSLINS